MNRSQMADDAQAMLVLVFLVEVALEAQGVGTHSGASHNLIAHSHPDQ